MILEDINKFSELLCSLRKHNPELKVVLTCGGFDPVHIGHLRCFQESVKIKNDLGNSIFVIVANGDEFLKAKKGSVFMPELERMEILYGFKGVDYVVKWYDGSQNCSGAIQLIKPNIFTKGGDRNSIEKIPEKEACDKIGCEIRLGIGGKKVQSSSWLTKGKI